jgi:microcystin-dependent protein
MGQGPGISQIYTIGEKGGVESVTLNTQQIPIHTHAMLASTDTADQATGSNGVVATPPQLQMYFNATPGTPLNNNMLSVVGGSQPHENMQPYLVITFIISLFGVYPSQS